MNGATRYQLSWDWECAHLAYIACRLSCCPFVCIDICTERVRLAKAINIKYDLDFIQTDFTFFSTKVLIFSLFFFLQIKINPFKLLGIERHFYNT